MYAKHYKWALANENNSEIAKRFITLAKLYASSPDIAILSFIQVVAKEIENEWIK
jgi:hypothetical protein